MKVCCRTYANLWTPRGTVTLCRRLSLLPLTPPAEVEVEIDALGALLAAHADRGAQPAAAQQVAEEQETTMDGAEDDVTAQAAAQLSQEERVEQRNVAFAAEAATEARCGEGTCEAAGEKGPSGL